MIGLIKDELRGKIMAEFVALRPKTYFYLIDNGNSDSGNKKLKEKKSVIKRRLKIIMTLIIMKIA